MEPSCTHSIDSLLFNFVTDGGSRDEYRLVGGRGDFEGRVEVRRNGEWQTMCGLFWDIDNAEVLCWEIGYEYAVSATTGAGFGQGAGAVWEVKIDCHGGESSISNCPMSSSQPCSHTHDAGVVCSNASKIACLQLLIKHHVTANHQAYIEGLFCASAICRTSVANYITSDYQSKGAVVQLTMYVPQLYSEIKREPRIGPRTVHAVASFYGIPAWCKVTPPVRMILCVL